jgi:hypothetical protein
MYSIDVTNLVETLTTQGMVVGLCMALAGLVFMLMGVRISQALIAASYGFIGFVFGLILPIDGWAQLVIALLCATSLAIASTYVMRCSVAVLSGGWAGFLALQVLARMGLQGEVLLAISVMTCLGVVSLSLIMFEEIIAFVTSLEGALLLLGALMIFFSENPTLWAHVRGLLMTSPFFGPFLIVAGTVTGYYLQVAELRHKHTGGATL